VRITGASTGVSGPDARVCGDGVAVVSGGGVGDGATLGFGRGTAGEGVATGRGTVGDGIAAGGGVAAGAAGEGVAVGGAGATATAAGAAFAPNSVAQYQP
jgi:hypothetical protein